MLLHKLKIEIRLYLCENASFTTTSKTQFGLCGILRNTNISQECHPWSVVKGQRNFNFRIHICLGGNLFGAVTSSNSRASGHLINGF